MEDMRSNRDKLIDAAEALFAEKGYDATTTREISRTAGVPDSLVSYYFGTKGECYASVIERREKQHCKDIYDSFAEARRKAGDRPLTVREMYLAFWAPILDKRLRSGPGWRAYIQILARAASVPASTEAYLVPYRTINEVLPQLLIDTIKMAYPDAVEEKIYWAWYISSSSMIHIVLENGRIDVISKGLCKASDLDQIVEYAADIFEAGFEHFLRTVPPITKSVNSRRRSR